MGDLLVTTISLGSFGLRVQLFFQIACSCGWNALTILLLVEGIKRESSYSGIKPRACTQDLCLMLSVNIRCWTNEQGDCFHAKWFGKGGRDKRDVCAKRKGGGDYGGCYEDSSVRWSLCFVGRRGRSHQQKPTPNLPN